VKYLQKTPSFSVKPMIISFFPNVPQSKKDLSKSFIISGSRYHGEGFVGLLQLQGQLDG
jgi:hypothetical protein